MPVTRRSVLLLTLFLLLPTIFYLYYKWQYAKILPAFPNQLDHYRFVDISVPTGYETSGCVSIDDAGTVAGWASRANGETGEFLWRDGKFLRVTPSNLQHTDTPTPTNDKGDVAANVHDVFDEIREIDSRAILKVKRGVFTFQCEIWPEERSPFRDVFAADVNNSRQVVGSMCDWSSCHAFLWQGESAVDLNTRLERKDWVLDSADGINDNGWIAGTGSRFGKSRAFLFVPVK